MSILDWFRKKENNSDLSSTTEKQPEDEPAQLEDTLPEDDSPEDPPQENDTPVDNPQKTEIEAIYHQIKNAQLPDGSLPDGFGIECERLEEPKIKFAPGATDGIRIYHTAPSDMTEKLEKIYPILDKMLSQRDFDCFIELLNILEEHSAYALLDGIINYIGEHPKYHQTAVMFAMYSLPVSTAVEILKWDIAIVGMFKWGEEQFAQPLEYVTVLGQFPEFTFYALRTLHAWSEDLGNKWALHYAKTTKDWGKIHAVEHLSPNTPEIKDWIIRYGCFDCITPAYLAIICAENGELIEVLRQEELDDELFAGVSEIMRGLIEEGPRPGMSAYEFAEEAENLYKKHAQSHDPALNPYTKHTS